MFKTTFTGLLAAASLALALTSASAQIGRRRRQELHRAAAHGRDDDASSCKAKGFKVDKRAGLGTAPLRQAQEAGQVDVYWEYTGTSLITFNKVDRQARCRRDLRQGEGARRRQGTGLAQPLEGQQHLRARHAQGGRRRPRASRRSPISPRKVKGGQAMKFGCNAEFYARPDGLAPLREDLRLRVRPRERGADGYRPRLPGAARCPGRCRARLRHRRPRSGLRLRHPDRRQGLFPELRADPGGPQGNARQEPEARRDPERACPPSSTTPPWRS